MPEFLMFSAVVGELNPLHFGHLSLLDAARRRSAGVVCIMSGHFVQRGGPAILDKWARTRLALAAGADLVAELPPPWACAGAERFAQGGVALAGSLAGVGQLFFGSEKADPAAITRAARALLSPGFSQALARQPDTGASFARRRQQALEGLIGGDAALLGSPNAALGVEYTKAILGMGLPLRPVPIPRTGAAHDQPAAPGEYLSASQLRGKILAGESLRGFVPGFTCQALEEEKRAGRCPASLAYLERPILARLRGMARQACSLEELYALVKTKRYTHARIRRLVMAAFLGFTGDLPALPPYLPVLGMTARGAALLKGCSLPVVTRLADVSRLPPAAQALYSLCAQADDLYALSTPSPQPCGRGQREKVIKM